MDESLLDQIRSTCRVVAEKAVDVRINSGYIPSYAASLPLDRLELPEINSECHYLDHGNDTLAFFLTLDAINFGSGYFPRLHKRPGLTGYFTVASSLTDWFRKYGPIPAQQLALISAEDCGKVFRQKLSDPAIGELMRLFAAALNELGRHVLDRCDGSFALLVEMAGGQAERLVRMLSQMSFFQDVAIYKGLEVPFYKRAQIAAADLYLAFKGQGPGQFEDIDRLTIFADNLVPHVLRMDGVLHYEKDLANRIEKGEEIPAGSSEEIEIRACAVHAVELVLEEFHQRGYTLNALQLDQFLWNRGQQPFYRAHSRHRTRTIFY
jgi:hypothetical protein